MYIGLVQIFTFVIYVSDWNSNLLGTWQMRFITTSYFFFLSAGNNIYVSAYNSRHYVHVTILNCTKLFISALSALLMGM